MATSNLFQESSKQSSQLTALKRKTEQFKKGELLREIQKLNVQIQALEREKFTHIYSKRSEFRQDFTPLEDEELKMTDERQTEKIKTKQQLEKISQMVKKFHRELRDVKPTPEFVEKLKMIMEEIEGTISTFKEQQKVKYDELMRFERTFFQELEQLESKFESWNQASESEIKISSAPSARSLASDMDVTKNLPPEVAAFDKFVAQSGGHRGGWDEHDHQTFVRYRNMYKGRIVFLDHVKPLLPVRTESEIREHETWYQEYLFLKDNKKYAIRKWREKKEEEREDAVTQVEEELVKAKEEERKRGQQTESAEEKIERCKQLNAWRVQKELEKAMKEERTIKQEVEKKKSRKRKEKNKLIEAKKMVEEFRHQKQMEEEMLKMLDEERKQQEMERKKELISKEISRFRSRDNQRLAEKQEKEKEKEEKKKEKQRKLEALRSQVAVEVPRDPERLLQPTAGWKERLKPPNPVANTPVINMPHRAIPSWRQGMF
uniref:Coiled-coil domain-containing protein 112 n=1 Tax=Biomphalaria glabrata TaxID=6526 RepID=A0A2C9LG35_BIOGL